MSRFAGILDETTGDFEKSSVAYCVDAICIIISALFGITPVTPFIESSTGIADGAKTGIAGMTTGIAFFISLFFAPIFASIPAWATGKYYPSGVTLTLTWNSKVAPWSSPALSWSGTYWISIGPTWFVAHQCRLLVY